MVRRKKDIPFELDPASRLLPWIVAVMVYIAGLSIAGAFILSAFANRWEQGLAGSITIQIPPTADSALDSKQQDRKAREAIRLSHAIPGVASAEQLMEEEMRALLEPWLGASIDPSDLPLPTLITVTFRQGLTTKDIDLGELRRRLTAVIPEAQIDDHGEWQARLVAFMGSLQWVARVLVAIVALAGIVMVIFATRGGLLAHHSTIELLHLVGARDNYIAAQFQDEAMKAGLLGGVLGVLATVATVVALGQGAEAVGTVLPSIVVLGVLDWFLIVLLPVPTALIAVLAARLTVMRALARML